MLNAVCFQLARRLGKSQRVCNQFCNHALHRVFRLLASLYSQTQLILKCGHHNWSPIYTFWKISFSSVVCDKSTESSESASAYWKKSGFLWWRDQRSRLLIHPISDQNSGLQYIWSFLICWIVSTLITRNLQQFDAHLGLRLEVKSGLATYTMAVSDLLVDLLHELWIWSCSWAHDSLWTSLLNRLESVVDLIHNTNSTC